LVLGLYGNLLGNVADLDDDSFVALDALRYLILLITLRIVL
jgi:hypothetical protein